MKQITPNNFGDFASHELANLFANNEAEIVADTFAGFKLVFDAIVEEIKNGGHFRKDVRTFINLQQQLNLATDKRISELENKQ